MFVREALGQGWEELGPPRKASRCCHGRVPAAAVTARGRQRPGPRQPASMAFLTTWKREAPRKRDFRYRTAAREGTPRGPCCANGRDSAAAGWRQQVTAELGDNCHPRTAQGFLHPHMLPAHLHSLSRLGSKDKGMHLTSLAANVLGRPLRLAGRRAMRVLCPTPSPANASSSWVEKEILDLSPSWGKNVYQSSPTFSPVGMCHCSLLGVLSQLPLYPG